MATPLRSASSADGAANDVGYAELGKTVSEVGSGLIELGIESGDRVAIVCATGPEWTHAESGITTVGRRRRPDLRDHCAQAERINKFVSSAVTCPRRPAS